MSKEYSLPPVGLFKAPGSGIVLSSLTAPLSATPSLSPRSPSHAALFPAGSRTAVTTTAKPVDKNRGASNPPSQVVNFKFFDVDIDFLPSEPPHVAQRHHPLVMGIVLEAVYCYRRGARRNKCCWRPFGRGGRAQSLYCAVAAASADAVLREALHGRIRCASLIAPETVRSGAIKRLRPTVLMSAVTARGECVEPARSSSNDACGSSARANAACDSWSRPANHGSPHLP